jgi:hypothetical protein
MNAYNLNMLPSRYSYLNKKKLREITNKITRLEDWDKATSNFVFFITLNEEKKNENIIAFTEWISNLFLFVLCASYVCASHVYHLNQFQASVLLGGG